MPCTPVYFTFDFALQSYAHSSSYRKPQLCKPASSCPSLSLPAHYTFPQALNPPPCMLSQVQENWAVCGEPFEFALCIRIPYCEVPCRLTVGQLPCCSLPKSFHKSILAFTFTDYRIRTDSRSGVHIKTAYWSRVLKVGKSNGCRMSTEESRKAEGKLGRIWALINPEKDPSKFTEALKFSCPWRTSSM